MIAPGREIEFSLTNGKQKLFVCCNLACVCDNRNRSRQIEHDDDMICEPFSFATKHYSLQASGSGGLCTDIVLCNIYFQTLLDMFCCDATRQPMRNVGYTHNRHKYRLQWEL